MMHTLERYLTPQGGESDITDRLAEGLLIATRDAGRRALANPNDYEARASLMWAGSVSHNDYTGCGRARLFPVHKLEHELSAFRDEIAHGAGLSVLFPAWALYEMERDIPRFAQLANRVLGVEMDFANPARTAREGILHAQALSSRRSACRCTWRSSASSRKTTRRSPKTPCARSAARSRAIRRSTRRRLWKSTAWRSKSGHAAGRNHVSPRIFLSPAAVLQKICGCLLTNSRDARYNS